MTDDRKTDDDLKKAEEARDRADAIDATVVLTESDITDTDRLDEGAVDDEERDTLHG